MLLTTQQTQTGPAKLTPAEQLARAPKVWIVKLLALVIVLLLIAWSGSMLDYRGVRASGLTVVGNLLSGLLHPDMSLYNLTANGIPYLLLETVCIAFLGTIFGAILAIPVAFLASSNIMPKPVALIARMFIMALRTIPSFVYGLMFIRVSGPGPFAGVLTMSICSIGMIAKMYIESIEDLNTSILESLDAAGCTAFQKIRYGILPQLFTNFVSTTIYRFDINLRDATVLGLVGAGGIGAPMIFAMNAYNWRQVGAFLLGLIVLVLIVEVVSTRIRVKLARG